MIERIEWDRLSSSPSELSSPFMRGKGERPLRITLHSESLAALSVEEKGAMELILELGNLPEIEIFETRPSNLPHIVVREAKPEDDFIPVELIHKGTLQLSTLVWNKRQWPIIAARMVSPNNQSEEAIKDMLNVLVLAQAHRSVRGDILITKSPLLLSNLSQAVVSETNPRVPLEAAKVVGLFLRSRNNYTYKAAPKARMSFDRGLFYWVLARYRLPSMWRYFSACVAAGKTRGDDIQELGGAILVRAVRALEARDAIGIQFYMLQNNNTEDQMVYHFDYLTLVLAGAIDAQARVANRAYQTGTRERYASFRRREFRTALMRNGAHKLYELTSSEKFKSLLTLLYEPRNTIHGAALKSFTYQGTRGPQRTLIAVPQPINQQLLEAAEQLGGGKEWGLTSAFQEVWLEPYSYSVALVKESLDAISEVAASTDVGRLFQVDQPIPPLKDEAPANSVFEWGKRLSLMA